MARGTGNLLDHFTHNGKLEAAQKQADAAYKAAALANNRINGLDDYETIRTVSVLFKLNSSIIDATAKQTIDDAAAWAKGEKAKGNTNGWLVEVSTSEASVSLTLTSGKTLKTDGVLIAAGRSSNTQDLNLSAAGITTGKRGLLSVNRHFQTEVPHIYAAGDVIGFPALASTSMEQARVAMCHAFDSSLKTEIASLLPTGIFTIPEVSAVGETEESLRSKATEYVVGMATARTPEVK